MTKQLTDEIEQHVDAFLALEYEASKPYNNFVYDNEVQALDLRHLLFDARACEFAPPHGRMLLEDGKPIGMIAFLTGQQVSQLRLKGAMLLSKAGVFGREPALQRRLQLAGKTLVKPQSDDFYLSRIAVASSERGRGTGSFLLADFEREGRKLRCRRLTLEVNRADQPAVNFYLKHQFSELGSLRVADAETGRSLEYMQMARLLD